MLIFSSMAYIFRLCRPVSIKNLLHRQNFEHNNTLGYALLKIIEQNMTYFSPKPIEALEHAERGAYFYTRFHVSPERFP